MNSTLDALEPLQRELGSYSSGIPGPLTVVIGGLHGNEPAGVLAARRVLRALNERRPQIRGRLLALSGNMDGLRRALRFVDLDLNRVWTDGEISGIRRERNELSTERREQLELLEIIERELAAHDHAEQVIFLDLHSTSGIGPPFSIIGDTLGNRRIAMALGIPVILGLEETIDGTLLGWLAGAGYTSVGIEGGQNEDPETVDNLEATIWLGLVASGQLDEADVPDLDKHREGLAATAQGIPEVVEIRYRHGLTPDARFEMEGLFANFEPVEAGQLLARSWDEDGSVEVRAPESGLLLMPRYQGQGVDGFFVGRRVHRFWLNLSVWLRRVRTSFFLALLPGISRPEGKYGPLHVNRHIARWFSVELFHLLGYRKKVDGGHRMIFSRRRERPPQSR